MEQYERDAREAVAKALEAENFPANAAAVRKDMKSLLITVVFRALLPLLAVSDLQRRALEACETYARATDGTPLPWHGCDVRDIGRESLEAKKPKGPWQQHGAVAVHADGRSVTFQKPGARNDPAACAAFVASENEKASRG